MKAPLWSMLVSFVALSVAGCATPPAANYTFAQASGGPDCRRLAHSGDTMIKIYCRKTSSAALSASAQASGDLECRLLAEPRGTRIRSFCGSAPEWSSFDIWAVDAGVTCRWTGGLRGMEQPVVEGDILTSDARRQELCLTGTQWRNFEVMRIQAAAGDFTWELSPPMGKDMPSAGNLYGAGGYGYFPAGGAIGQELTPYPPAAPPSR